MNKYSWLQQKLHQLALSSNFMREMVFDVESSLISTTQAKDNNVFVSGLARSGTTILLNALYESSEFSSLSYRDMPFVLAPNIWSKLSFSNKKNDALDRAHGDGIKISEDSPEAFEEVFWMTFDESDKNTKEQFKKYVGLINHKAKTQRYLSKNNQNIKRLELISTIFPNSKILIPFRNPVQHAYSLLCQHEKFIEYSNKDAFISSYMEWTGHTEFGPNYVPVHNKELNFVDFLSIDHWLEQWCLTYKKLLETLKNKKNIHFVCYEQLCSSKKYWLDILRVLDIKETYDFEFKESHKIITLDIDDGIRCQGLSLYADLCYLSKLH